MPARPRTAAAIGLLAGASLLAAQVISLAAGGRVEAVGVPAVWTAAAVVALAGTLAAALRVPNGAVRTAWLLWSVGSAAWLAGAFGRDLVALTRLDSLALVSDALWWLFAACGVAGLRLRTPSGSFSLRLFMLDALPVVLLATALSLTAFGDAASDGATAQLTSGVYAAAYAALALASFQLMAIDGFARVPSNMWVLGPGFLLTASAALVWPGRDSTTSAAGTLSALLWTAGLLVIGAAGFRRAFAPAGFSRLFRPYRESGARAVPPAAAVVGLVASLFFVSDRAEIVLDSFLLVAVLSVGLRFYLVRQELVRSQAALREGEERYRELFDNARDCVFTLDLGGAFTSANLATERLFGHTCEALLGRRLSDFVSPGSNEAFQLAIDPGPTVERREVVCELDLIVKGGHHVPLDVSARAAMLHGEPVGWQCIGRDETERKLFVEQLRHQAFHDALTGLANRDLFADRVEQALARRSSATPSTAVLFLDLDDFKTVNDTTGHHAGDMFLVEFAVRLRSCVRPSDTCARIGGDEFAILLEESSCEAAVAVADRILGTFRSAISLGGREVVASVSIGIALAGSGESSDELLCKADVAMYEAKASGGGRHSLCKAPAPRIARARPELTAGLASPS